MLKQPVTVHCELAPWRRYAGFWFSVLWLTVLAQPCAMAAITGALVAGTQSMDHDRSTAIGREPCDGYSIANEGCVASDLQPGQACCDSNLTTSFDTVAVLVPDIKSLKFELPILNVGNLHGAREHLTPSVLHIKPERLPPGPSINNLFCVYLN